MKAKIQNDMLIVNGRSLSLKSIESLLENSDNLNEFSQAISKAVFSIASVASFILTCPTIKDEDRSIGGDNLPDQNTFYTLEVLTETLRRIEQ
jgi:hypothetical protein